MRHMAADTQERKDETVSAAVTRTEKQSIAWLALTLNEPDGMSGVLRKMGVNAALEMAADLRSRLDIPADATAA